MVLINKKSYRQSKADVTDKYYELFRGQGGEGLMGPLRGDLAAAKDASPISLLV